MDDTPGLWDPPSKEDIAQRIALAAVKGYRDFLAGKSLLKTRAKIEQHIEDLTRKTETEEDHVGDWRERIGYSIGLLEGYEDRRRKK